MEQIDQGEAYCLNCNTTDPNEKCDHPPPPTPTPGQVPMSDYMGARSNPVERVTLPREVKTEIENLRRLVQTVQDRLHALTRT